MPGRVVQVATYSVPDNPGPPYAVPSFTCAYTSPNTAGNCLIAIVGYLFHATDPGSITDSLGNTWTQIGSIASSGVEWTKLFLCEHCLAGANTITATTHAYIFILAELAGIIQPGSLDVESDALADHTSVITTGPDFLIFIDYVDSAPPIVPMNTQAWTALAVIGCNDYGGGGSGLAAWWTNKSVAGTYPNSSTAGTQFGVILAGLKTTGGSGPGIIGSFTGAWESGQLAGGTS